mgnify:CR=1 FL=1
MESFTPVIFKNVRASCLCANNLLTKDVWGLSTRNAARNHRLFSVDSQSIIGCAFAAIASSSVIFLSAYYD